MAEQIGEEGGRAFASSKGYEPILDGTMKLLPQGPDWVGRSTDGTVHVLEFKGGSGQLGHAYGYPQGSTEWAVESTKLMLRSPNASVAEKRAAELILQAATKGKLEVHVIRTSHVLGEPIAAVLEQSTKITEKAIGLTKTALNDLGRCSAEAIESAASRTARLGDDAVRSADEALVASGTAGAKVLKGVAKVAVPVAVGVDIGMRAKDAVDVERRFDAGEITQEQRELAHAKNAAGLVGGWGGAVAGAEIGAAGGGAIGGPIGAGLGGVAGGVAGYFGGEVAMEAAADTVVEAVHSTGTTLKGAVESAWGSAGKAANSAAEAVESAWSWGTD
jgi:hypothetical protein